jgi:hypothetical protein
VLVDGVATTDFEFNSITQKIKINVTFSETQVTFTAGYVVTPKIVKQAVLIAISNAFVNRDEVVVGQTVVKLPNTSEDLLNRVKFHGA